MDVSLYEGRQSYGLKDWIGQVSEDKWMDTTAYLGADQKRPLKVVVQRVLKEIVEKRKKTLKKLKKKHRPLSAHQFKLYLLNVFISNLTIGWKSAKQVLYQNKNTLFNICSKFTR